jgi:hypothetical protein
MFLSPARGDISLWWVPGTRQRSNRCRPLRSWTCYGRVSHSQGCRSGPKDVAAYPAWSKPRPVKLTPMGVSPGPTPDTKTECPSMQSHDARGTKKSWREPSNTA